MKKSNNKSKNSNLELSYRYDINFDNNLIGTLRYHYRLNIKTLDVVRIGSIIPIARQTSYGAGSSIELDCIEHTGEKYKLMIYANLKPGSNVTIKKVLQNDNGEWRSISNRLIKQ